MKEIPYDRSAAVAYAQEWAFGRNPQYYDFEAIGGDCTNFVSQCLYAGAGVMNFTPDIGWYYRSPFDRAAAWTGVTYLRRFLTTNRSVGPYADAVPQWQAEVGDIVMLCNQEDTPYHAMLITALSPTILIASHSYDALHRPLYTYSAPIICFLHIDGVRSHDR